MERGSPAAWKHDGYFWRKVGIPVLMPGILGTFSVLFANALAAYATVYALMMNNISLLPVQIAGSYVGEVKTRPGLGGALSVVMMLMMVLMILIYQSCYKKIPERRQKMNAKTKGARILMVFIMIYLLIPLVVTIIYSLF